MRSLWMNGARTDGSGLGIAVLLTLALNLWAHFLPFERASVSADDIDSLLVQPSWGYVRSQLASYRRPLEVSYTLLDWLAGENQGLWVFLPYLTSSLLAVAVLLLFRELLGNPAMAWPCAALFVLLPNKQELYHHLVYAHINAVYTVITMSLVSFIAYLRGANRLLLWASLGCYALSIFWYELGFFLPFVLLTAACLHPRRRLASCFLFFIPALLYLLWRTGILRGGGPMEALRPINFWGDLFVTVPNLFFGRQMIKSIVYGLARFPAIELPWLVVLAAGNLLILWGFFRWLRSRPIPAVSLRLFALLAAMGIFFILPSILSPGIISSRHTALSSIGLAVLPVALARLLPRERWRAPSLTALLGIGLIISQGTAWSQVVSCRINHAIRQTLLENRDRILGSDRVLIDQYSFAQRIPYTWVKDPLNHLDTYWGVHGLLGTGYSFLVPWTVGRHLPVQIVRSPVRVEGEAFLFQAYNPGTYRFEEQRVAQKGTVLIDYAAVYPTGFHHGKRR